MNLSSSQIRRLVRATVVVAALAAVAVPTASADHWYRDAVQTPAVVVPTVSTDAWYRDTVQVASSQPVDLDPAIATAIRAHDAASSLSYSRAQRNARCTLEGVDPAIFTVIRARGHCLRTRGR